MVSSEQMKTLLVFMFYGFFIALLAWIGYVTAKFSIKIGAELGSVVGALLGIMIVVFLWYKVGKKFVETTSP